MNISKKVLGLSVGIAGITYVGYKNRCIKSIDKEIYREFLREYKLKKDHPISIEIINGVDMSRILINRFDKTSNQNNEYKTICTICDKYDLMEGTYTEFHNDKYVLMPNYYKHPYNTPNNPFTKEVYNFDKYTNTFAKDCLEYGVEVAEGAEGLKNSKL